MVLRAAQRWRRSVRSDRSDPDPRHVVACDESTVHPSIDELVASGRTPLLRALIIGLNYDPEPTGIAPYTSALCRGLKARGHEVRVITAMPHYPFWKIDETYQGWTRRDVVDGVPVLRLRHYVPRRPSQLRRFVSECTFGLRVALTRWGGPDLVVFVSPALFASGIAIVGRVPLQPFVVWVQDIYSLGIAETQRRGSAVIGRVVRALEGYLLGRATGVAVIHGRFVGVLERIGVPLDRLRVVRNWTHLAPRRPSDRAAVRERLGWSPDETVVLHAGAMGVKQDLGNVVSAARLAEEGGAPIKFVLSGTGSERDRLEQSAAGLQAIRFADPVPSDEFQDYLAAADVLLVNEHGGLRDMAVPSKLTSYFTSGRPVVAATSSASATAEEVQASGGGVRVEPGEPEALLCAVMELRANRSAADRLGAAGVRYQESTLTESAALGGYIDWLEGLVTRARRRSKLVGLRRYLRADR